jgi:serine/threonine protein kinase
VLQQEVRKGWRRNLKHHALPELVIAERLGHGGYGAVYRGCWHKNVAAIKVMYVHRTDHGAMSDAMEMAVLSSIQHPNIVSVYACLTDMVECSSDKSDNGAVSSGLLNGSGGGALKPSRLRYRRLQADECGEDADVCNIMVMEVGGRPAFLPGRSPSGLDWTGLPLSPPYRALGPSHPPNPHLLTLHPTSPPQYCDLGTLHDSIKAGRFHTWLPGGAIGIDLASAIEALLDVAYAVQYLHSLQLVHGDIKVGSEGGAGGAERSDVAEI